MASPLLNKYPSIVINDRVLYYRGFTEVSEVGDLSWTEFYEETEFVSKRRWLFFGKKRTVERPKLLFVIHENCKNTRLSKEWWREKILKELELTDRDEQLKKGELI